MVIATNTLKTRLSGLKHFSRANIFFFLAQEKAARYNMWTIALVVSFFVHRFVYFTSFLLFCSLLVFVTLTQKKLPKLRMYLEQQFLFKTGKSKPSQGIDSHCWNTEMRGRCPERSTKKSRCRVLVLANGVDVPFSS